MLRYNIPDPYSIEVVADWTELYVAYSKKDISKSGLASYVEESSGGEASEHFIDNVWQELERREYLYGKKPPFRVVNQIIERTISWTEHPGYMTCLIFSLEGNPSGSTESGKLFERLSNNAVKNYINGESVIYGFPGKQKVKEISGLLKEKYTYDPPFERKDRGLDIIAWKPLGDGRASQLILLVQCASGHNWKSKLNDLNLNAWCSYIHFACKPIKAFTIPVVIFNDESLREHSWDGGLILDRTRLYRNIIETGEISDDSLESELVTWCNNRLTEINR